MIRKSRVLTLGFVALASATICLAHQLVYSQGPSDQKDSPNSIRRPSTNAEPETIDLNGNSVGRSRDPQAKDSPNSALRPSTNEKREPIPFDPIENGVGQSRAPQAPDPDEVMTATYRVENPLGQSGGNGYGNTPNMTLEAIDRIAIGVAYVYAVQKDPSATSIAELAKERYGAASRLNDPFAEKIAESVKTLVDPKSWSDHGGQGQIIVVPGALIIRQTRAIHQKLPPVLQPFSPVLPSSGYYNAPPFGYDAPQAG